MDSGADIGCGYRRSVKFIYFPSLGHGSHRNRNGPVLIKMNAAYTVFCAQFTVNFDYTIYLPGEIIAEHVGQGSHTLFECGVSGYYIVHTFSNIGYGMHFRPHNRGVWRTSSKVNQFQVDGVLRWMAQPKTGGIWLNFHEQRWRTQMKAEQSSHDWETHLYTTLLKCVLAGKALPWREN